MRKIALLLITFLCIYGCKKKDNDNPPPKKPEPVPVNYSNKIVLNEPEVIGDSLKLSWSKLDTFNCVGYTLFRKDDADGVMLPIQQLYKKETTTTTDIMVPYSSSVQYQVAGDIYYGKSISSNVVTYSRPGIASLKIDPYDVIYSKTDKLLYFFEQSGKITIYSTSENAVVRSIDTKATIGYSDFGFFKGRKELYVPRNDGWIYVYDAITLEKITQISTGLGNSCIVFNNNNLYVSTSATFYNPIRVLGRETGSLISQTGEWGDTRFKQIPKSDFKLLEITINLGPVDQDTYSFTTGGKLISQEGDVYHGDYFLDAKIFEFFPDGSKYVTASQGAVYTTEGMRYLATLPRGNLSFTTFSVNQTENRIYAGTDSRQIKVYSTDDYRETKTIPTKAYPYKLFDLGDQLLCISLTSKTCLYCTPGVTRVVIENINK